MCLGGIYEHLSGGFARNSTNEYWLAPHFEKMLYDNAFLIEFNQAEWMDEAETDYTLVKTQMNNVARMHHSWRDGKADHPTTLDNYAQMVRTALILYKTTTQNRYLKDAIEWVVTLKTHYWDTENGGYFVSADDSTDTIVRPKTAQNNPVPAGNGIMVEVLVRILFITSNSDYEDRANQLISALTPEDPCASLHHPMLMCRFELLMSST